MALCKTLFHKGNVYCKKGKRWNAYFILKSLKTS